MTAALILAAEEEEGELAARVHLGCMVAGTVPCLASEVSDIVHRESDISDTVWEDILRLGLVALFAAWALVAICTYKVYFSRLP